MDGTAHLWGGLCRRGVRVIAALSLAGLALMTGCTTAPVAPSPSASKTVPVSPSPAVSQTAPPLTDARAGELSEALGSGDPVEVAEVVAMPAGTTIPPEAAAQFEALGSITVVAGSFTPIDAVTGVAEATSANGRWKVYLVFQDGTWRIASTEQLS